ncbi:carbohydrate porin [Lutimonas sp.]|uniref:carbohydrate porin n=1 Tax=Lutimonas sp. TaxID=1872403 RepID=UPI003D9B06F8
MKKILLSTLFIFVSYAIFAQIEHMEIEGRFNLERESGFLVTSGSYFDWKKMIKEDHHFDYSLSFTPQWQIGSSDQKHHLNSELDFVGFYQIKGKNKLLKGIRWWFVWNQTYMDYTTEQFSKKQGLNIQTNDGNTFPDLTIIGLPALWWEQDLTSFMGFRAGQLFGQSIYANNEFIDNDRTDFMATPLAGPNGVNWMDYPIGLGIQLSFWTDYFSLDIGFQDTKANGNYPDFESFFKGNFVYLAELAYHPNFGNPSKEGKYGITFSYSDHPISGPGSDYGHGLVFNMFQKFSSGIGIFSRYSNSFDQYTSLKSSFVAGLTFDNLLKGLPDRLGIAYMSSVPSDEAQRIEQGLEFYWRFTLSGIIEFTPDLQYYFKPAISREEVFILGFRCRVAI